MQHEPVEHAGADSETPSLGKRHELRPTIDHILGDDWKIFGATG